MYQHLPFEGVEPELPDRILSRLTSNVHYIEVAERAVTRTALCSA